MVVDVEVAGVPDGAVVVVFVSVWVAGAAGVFTVTFGGELGV